MNIFLFVYRVSREKRLKRFLTAAAIELDYIDGRKKALWVTSAVAAVVWYLFKQECKGRGTYPTF